MINILIVEGPDCVGKTTLAQRLVKELNTNRLYNRWNNHVYAHFTRLPPSFDRFWGYVERASQNIVQDRYHLSEILYADARGDVSPLSPEIYRLVDAKIRLLAGYTVLITATPELISERWKSDQMFSLTKTLQTAYLYSHLGEKFSHYRIDIDHHIHCDGTKPYVTDEDINRILDAYTQRLRDVTYIAKCRPFALQASGLL